MNISISKLAQNSRKTHTGFTIVELLIVIVVIAVLAAISVVAYNGVQTRAKNSQIQAAAASYARSLQLYATDNGALPTAAQTGAVRACLGNYGDICANANSTIARSEFNELLAPYRGGTQLPDLPEEWVYTNVNNNWWRGVWYDTTSGMRLRFVQYRSTECPSIAGTTFISRTSAGDGTSNGVNSLCNVSIDF